MSLMHSPQIVTSGLVFAYDMANTQKSWKGAPTTNLLSNPNNFNAWVQIGITVTASSEPAPVGSESAFAWTCVNSTNHQLYQARTSASTSQFSVYAKMTAHRGFYLAVYNNGYAAYFDLASGTVTSTVGAGVVGTINYYQNGWWICNISVPSSAVEVHIGFLDAVYTGTSSSPWAVSTAVGTTGLIACSQFEVGTFRTPYVNGTRSNTQVIVDLVGNNTVTANSLTYNSDGTFSFNSTSDYITPSSISDTFLNGGSWTMSAFVRFTSVNRGTDNAIFGHGSASANNGLHLAERGGYVYFGFYANDLGGTKQLSAGNWYEITFVFDYATKSKTIYVNGAYDNGGGSVGYSGTGSNFQIGKYPWSPGNRAYGSISTARIYNRALSAAEVKQNFNALRGRYSI